MVESEVVAKVTEAPAVVEAKPTPSCEIPVPLIALQENTPLLQVRALLPPVQLERAAPHSLVVEADPVLSILKSVVVALAVDDEMRKAVL